MSDQPLLDEFILRATLGGAKVTLADSIGEAHRYLRDLIKSHDIGVAVSAGTALTEQLGLQSVLEQYNVKVTATELVGWVLQLSRGKEVPLERVAALLSSAAGLAVSTEPKAIMSIARAAIREAYAGADLGISEADFGIAESGALVTLEHTSNARLAAVLPRLHLTLLDHRGIVPTLAAAANLIKDRSGGIPGHKLPNLITHLTSQGKSGNGHHGKIPGTGRTVDEHVLIVRF